MGSSGIPRGAPRATHLESLRRHRCVGLLAIPSIVFHTEGGAQSHTPRVSAPPQVHRSPCNPLHRIPYRGGRLEPHTSSLRAATGASASLQSPPSYSIQRGPPRATHLESLRRHRCVGLPATPSIVFHTEGTASSHTPRVSASGSLQYSYRVV